MVNKIDLKSVEYIDGERFKTLYNLAYKESGGNPLINFSSILTTVERKIYNILPENKLYLNIRKYFTSDNVYLVKIPKEYKFRPDIVSFVFYKNIEYFHLVLLANNLKSFLEFDPHKQNVFFIFKEEILSKILE